MLPEQSDALKIKTRNYREGYTTLMKDEISNEIKNDGDLGKDKEIACEEAADNKEAASEAVDEAANGAGNAAENEAVNG